jgi:hypothetical protein
MTYTPQTWHDNDPATPLSAARLTVMETGIATASLGWFNVKDPAYGAVGDGVADDTTALQAAITAAQTAGGGVVYIPEGVYKITAALTVTAPNVHLIGAGWDQATLTSGSIIKAGAAITHIVSVSSAGTHFAAEAVSFDQAGQATNGLTIDGLNAQVFQCHARNPATNGAGFNVTSGGTSAWFTNCRFNGANSAGTTGFLIDGTDSTMQGCKAVNCQDSVQYTGGASGAIQTACHHTPGSPIGRCAIFVNGNPSNISIVANRIDNHVLGSGIQISPTANVQGFQICDNLFFQNTITDATFAAIGVDTTSANIRQLVVTGNVVKSAASHTYAALLTAQTLAGAAATNPTRIATAGTIASHNTVYAAAVFGASSQPMVASGNVLTVDAATYLRVEDRSIEATNLARNGGAQYRETFPWWACQNNETIPATGVMTLTGIILNPGDVFTNLSFISGSTAGATLTHWWFALYDATLTLVAQTADQTSTAWAANTTKTLALTGGPFTITPAQSGYGYVAVMIAATTAPSIRGVTVNTSQATGVASQLISVATNGTALTTTAPAGPLTLSAAGTGLYAMLS